jgi:hypothetical protein
VHIPRSVQRSYWLLGINKLALAEPILGLAAQTQAQGKGTSITLSKPLLGCSIWPRCLRAALPCYPVYEERLGRIIDAFTQQSHEQDAVVASVPATL